jgi:hypothetical protein
MRRARKLLAGFGSRYAARRSKGQMVAHEREVVDPHTPPDVTSERAKSSRHGKSTADKWNQ